MKAPSRHLVALVLASNLMGCQLIKKFTDRNHDSGAAPTGTTVVTLDGGGMALPNPGVVAYDAAAWADAGAAANAAMAAANAAMAAAADASAQGGQALQNAQNALADASANTAVLVPTAVAEADAGAAMAAPPGVAPTAPAPVAQPAAPAAPTAPEPEENGHRPSRRHDDYCRRHPGQLHPRTGQICPNILGSQNLQR
jgi:hypothetical protein